MIYGAAHTTSAREPEYAPGYRPLAPAQFNMIVETAAKYYDIGTEDVLGKRREYCEARWLAMYLCYETSKASFPLVGRQFGVHHTSVMYGVAKVNEERGRKPDFATDVDQMLKRASMQRSTPGRTMTFEAPRAARRRTDVARLLSAVAKEFHTTPLALVYGQRTVAKARQIAMHLAYMEDQHISTTSLGRFFDLDHTTVSYGIRRGGELLAEDPALAARIAEARLTTGADLPPVYIEAGRPDRSVFAKKIASPGEALAPVIGTVDDDVKPALYDNESQSTFDMSRFVHVAADCFGVSLAEMFTPGRNESAVSARQLAIYLAREHALAPYPQLGKFFQIDHTTAIHAVTRVTARRHSDPEFAKRVDDAFATWVSTAKSMPIGRPGKEMNPRELVDMARFVHVAAECCGVTVAKMFEPGRTAPAASARHLAIYLARKHAGAPFSQIGGFFGIEHSAAMHGAARAAERIASDPAFAARVDDANAQWESAGRAMPIDQPGRVAIAGRAPQPRAVETPSELQAVTDSFRIGKEAIRLCDALQSSSHSRVTKQALRDIYLVDRLTSLDAKRLGLGAERDAALQRAGTDVAYRAILAPLRGLIHRRGDALYAAVGRMIKAERDAITAPVVTAVAESAQSVKPACAIQAIVAPTQPRSVAAALEPKPRMPRPPAPWRRHPATLAGKVEEVPIAWIKEHVPAYNELRYDTRSLAREIAANGIAEPLVIMVGKRDKRMILGEGNHRLDAAESATLDRVPVRIMRISEVGEEGAPFTPLLSDDVHWNADMRPSEIISGVQVREVKVQRDAVKINASHMSMAI